MQGLNICYSWLYYVCNNTPFPISKNGHQFKKKLKVPPKFPFAEAKWAAHHTVQVRWQRAVWVPVPKGLRVRYQQQKKQERGGEGSDRLISQALGNHPKYGSTSSKQPLRGCLVSLLGRLFGGLLGKDLVGRHRSIVSTAMALRQPLLNPEPIFIGGVLFYDASTTFDWMKQTGVI